MADQPATDSTVDFPAILYQGEYRRVLVDPPCVPLSEIKTLGFFDGKASQSLDRHFDRHNKDDGIYVGSDAVWIGNGIALTMLVESAVSLLESGEELNNQLRVFVPLDVGGTAAYTVVNKSVESEQLISTTLALEMVLIRDARENRPGVVLKVRNDITVPEALQAFRSTVLPDANILVFHTAPPTKSAWKHGIMLRQTKKVAGLSGAGVAALAVLVFSLSHMLDFSSATPPPSQPDDFDERIEEFASMTLEEIVAEQPSEVEQPQNPPIVEATVTVPVDDKYLDSYRSSVRWDVAAWSYMTDTNVWQDMNVNRLLWTRRDDATVIVVAFGAVTDQWPVFAAEWGATVSTESWVHRHIGKDITPNEESVREVIVKTLTGEYDVRQPLGDSITMQTLCSNSYGVPNVSSNRIVCDVSRWLPERWRYSTVALPRGRLDRAECTFGGGPLDKPSCILTIHDLSGSSA